MIQIYNVIEMIYNDYFYFNFCFIFYYIYIYFYFNYIYCCNCLNFFSCNNLNYLFYLSGVYQIYLIYPYLSGLYQIYFIYLHLSGVYQIYLVLSLYLYWGLPDHFAFFLLNFSFLFPFSFS